MMHATSDHLPPPSSTTTSLSFLFALSSPPTPNGSRHASVSFPRSIVERTVHASALSKFRLRTALYRARAPHTSLSLAQILMLFTQIDVGGHLTGWSLDEPQRPCVARNVFAASRMSLNGWVEYPGQGTHSDVHCEYAAEKKEQKTPRARVKRSPYNLPVPFTKGIQNTRHHITLCAGC